MVTVTGNCPVHSSPQSCLRKYAVSFCYLCHLPSFLHSLRWHNAQCFTSEKSSGHQLPLTTASWSLSSCTVSQTPSTSLNVHPLFSSAIFFRAKLFTCVSFTGLCRSFPYDLTFLSQIWVWRVLKSHTHKPLWRTRNGCDVGVDRDPPVR